ncbi:Shikimate kinase I [Streptococcus sp. DD10]|uniref:shikimate kinase n=1 Tax=Streptococcus sp. DD10 TaxID=1777878 RepID=UPI00079463BD|nr:shikimate kinase [Streptococcus sp. DD10]KXT75615.1 Shikimate kinase I [Streptococcus sp. DD10]
MAKVLVGFMGSGKSTIAERLDPQFLDMDTYIEHKIGETITDFFSKQGEKAFRAIETETLTDLLNRGHVLSTGGGVVTSAVNRKLLQEHKEVIYLCADFDTLYDRILSDKKNLRPLFLNNSRQGLKKIFEERQEWYKEVASQIIDVSNKTPEQIVEEIR